MIKVTLKEKQVLIKEIKSFLAEEYRTQHKSKERLQELGLNEQVMWKEGQLDAIKSFDCYLDVLMEQEK